MSGVVGVKLAPNKAAALQSAYQMLPLPDTLYLPLLTERSTPLVSKVRVNDVVSAGQAVAGDEQQWLHAPAAGVIKRIVNRISAHPSGVTVPTIVLRTAVADQAVADPADGDPVDCAGIAECIARAGIVGLGGGGFPSAQKIAGAVLSHIIINAVECEPYIACDEMLARHRADDAIAGAQLLLRATTAARATIAVEDGQSAGAQALARALAAADDQRLVLRVVSGRYPAGGERQLIQYLLGQEVPKGATPRDLGVGMFNLGTAVAVFDAVRRGQMLTHRMVTVTGHVKHPGNWWTPIGTPIETLVAAAGGYRPQAARLIIGGSMMGYAIASDAVPVTKSVNTVLVLSAQQLERPQPTMPCIRCGDCQPVCPARLQPQLLHEALRGDDLVTAEALSLEACIECGLCAQVCPSAIPLAQQFRSARARLHLRHQEHTQAAAAEARYERKRRRDAAVLARRLARREARKAQLADAASRQDAVAAAIARAKANKR